MQPGSTDYQSKKTGKKKKKEIKTGKGTRIKDQKEKRMTKKKKSAPEALRYINEVRNKKKKNNKYKYRGEQTYCSEQRL